jgi:pimeloyl-ACP methyl ester carboxylesterase
MKFMKTTAKIICFVICCLALAFSQRTNAQPVFQAAAIDSAPLGNRIPLILIHGIESDPSMWNNFLNYYAAHPALTNNFKPYTFGYKTDVKTMGPADPGDVFGLCPILGNSLEQSFGNKKVAILAHSMGGLVARAMMEYYTYPDGTRGGDRVLTLITLATPHHGTPAANEYIASYPAIPWFTIDNYWLSPGFAYNMEWDDYDGNMISDPPIPTIPSSQDFSKIVVYGGAITSDSSIPVQDYLKLDPPFDLIAGFYGYNNDGAVPIGSALFRKANSLKHFHK